MSTLIVKSLRRAPAGGIRHPLSQRMFAGGQYIPADLWNREKQAGKDGLSPLIAETANTLQFLRLSYQQNVALSAHPEIAQQYKIPVIPLTTVEARLKTAVRNSYRDAFLLGKRTVGNLTSVTKAESKALLKVRKDEFKFLRGFLSDMRTGGGVMEYGRRMETYGNAVREAYWLGWCLGDTSESRRISWLMGPTIEKCDDCVRFNAHGAYTRAEFIAEVLGKGYLPQGGTLACHGIHCLCSLSDIK